MALNTLGATCERHLLPVRVQRVGREKIQGTGLTVQRDRITILKGHG